MASETPPLTRRAEAGLWLVPGLAGLGVLAWWLFEDGGYAPTVWLPGLLVFLGLGAAAAVGRVGSLAALPRRSLLVLALFAAYVAWSAVSLLWAQDAGLALVGTLRAALFLVVLTLFAALPWRALSAERTLTGIVLAVFALGLVAMVRLASSAPASLPDLLLQSRLAWPLGYQNANAALWTMAALPALVLASRRETFWALRPVLLAAAAVLLDLGLLSQSRGWLFTLPLIALATALLVPGRVRLLLWALPLALAAGLAADPMLDVYRTGTEDMPPGRLEALTAAIDTASGRLVLAAMVALALGAVLTWLDRRVTPSPRLERAGRWAAIAGVALVLAGGITAAFVATDGDPGGRVSEAWDDFKANRDESGGEGRFAAFGSSRYDFWRVGLNEWREHALGGLGQDNFDEAYLVTRRNLTEEPRWAHSIELRMLVHTGLIGALLFFGAVALAVAAAVRARRLAGWVPAALLLPGVVWLVHGSVDWLWEYPALSGLALAPAGMALALTRRRSGSFDLPRPAVRRATVAACSAAALVLAGLAGATFVSERLQHRGELRFTTDPEGAFDDLERAASLQPLSGRPSLVAGLIALRLDDTARAQRLLAEAADRDPGSWFVRFNAGLAASAAGDREGARAALEAAQDRNPRERLIEQALRRVATARPLLFTEASQELANRLIRRFGSR